MEKLQLFLLIMQVVIAVVMIILVLLQKSDGDSLSGIGGGSGGANSIISSRTSASLLTKITMTLIAIFMANCLVLAVLSKTSQKSFISEIDKIAKEKENSKEVPAKIGEEVKSKDLVDVKTTKSKTISAPKVD
jgi:preprotein translocase subunit SecG